MARPVSNREYVLIDGEYIVRIDRNFQRYPYHGVPIWVQRLPRVFAQNAYLAQVEFRARGARMDALVAIAQMFEQARAELGLPVPPEFHHDPTPTKHCPTSV